MVTLATLVFVVPPALAASGVDYNVAGTIRLVRDLSQYGMPPPPAWDAEVEVIGPALYDAGKSWRAADPKQRNASRPP